MTNEMRRNRVRWLMIVVFVLMILGLGTWFFWRMLQREMGLLAEGIQSAARATDFAHEELPVGSVAVVGQDTIAELKRVLHVRTGDGSDARVVYVATGADPRILKQLETERAFGATRIDQAEPSSPVLLQLRPMDEIRGVVIGYLWFTNSGISLPVHSENSGGGV